MNTIAPDAPILVVGAGIMGAGIAQVAAQAGHPVFLYDLREGAAAEACRTLGATLASLAAKGRITPEAASATLARITPLVQLDQAAGAQVAIEAVVERIEAKRGLFQQLESLLDTEAVLATNTSSISVTAIANGLQHPERLVGMHFFNPVPLMKLVEVVSGLRTAPQVAAAIFDLAQSWGKVPVHARSTPGFIVNRIARPYYAETLALLQERAAAPEVLDACLKGAGFRMGPCELMDLIGHDTNFAVTQSVFEANFFDKRYVPSLVQCELVDGGLLGRKSGQGFYAYPAGAPALPAPEVAPLASAGTLVLHGSGAIADALGAALLGAGLAPQRQSDSAWTGLEVDGARLMLTDGRPAFAVARQIGSADVAVLDFPVRLPIAGQASLAYAMNASASAHWQAQAPAWLQTLGFTPRLLGDVPGLVVARTLAMLINEAADAVQHGVCTPEGADAAMRLGVNYPAGPFEWLAGWSVAGVVATIEALDVAYRGERYRVSPWLQRKAGT